ncbi:MULTISPECIES: type II toxin-antitoxin system VapC family toxin [unclassified Marinobacter]|uniref:type II toxin-antitoxin system VapC family toxin n=1 Tax=unclassified Marinobacter TaxID=83889 RepID=UPI000BF54871|nr:MULTISPECIES: type II toxin-antitoxin system VapC family toxin [unclassified Marinobacter]PFG11564.1 putative nucleic acid-binding protein [Marinobacter sp. LV10MA510-1]PFG53384.1 putative nucleic acid-binding protein [Marinobacter sp. LV10R520-4]
MLYFDTSAILPYYRQEQASDRVQALLQSQTRPVLISHLTKVEVVSALARWVRMGELSDPQANRIESAFHDDVSHGRFCLCPIEISHYQRAQHWIGTRKTSLRTLDALHLACAEHHQARLISEDDALVTAAAFFGIDASLA